MADREELKKKFGDSNQKAYVERLQEKSSEVINLSNNLSDHI